MSEPESLARTGQTAVTDAPEPGDRAPRFGSRRLSRRAAPMVLWAGAALACVALFLAGLPGRYDELRHPSPTLRDALARLGLAPGFYVAYNLALEALVALVFFGVALVIAWSRPRDRAALLIALILVAFGSGMPGTVYSVVIQQPIWEMPFSAAQAIGWPLLLLFPYIFPDGRFVPRRAWPVAVASGAWAVGFFVFAGTLGGTRQQVLIVGLIGWGICFGLGALAQLYRFRYVASAVERQQTKWVVLGFVAALVGIGVTVSYHVVTLVTLVTAPGGEVADLPQRLAAATLLGVSVAVIPLAVGVAILQYRLFDIDLLINRALVYGSLTALLGITYVVVVGLLELGTSRFAGQGSDLALALSTLVIAALFQPLRRRVQAAIDRRFYRGKYDAQRAIAEFGATVRSELDPEELNARLVAVVRETMRPRVVTLWSVGRTTGPGTRETGGAEARP